MATQGFYEDDPQFAEITPHFDGCPCGDCPVLRRTKKGKWRWKNLRKLLAGARGSGDDAESST